MRSILTRVPGLLLSMALAIAPQLAWAAPVETSGPHAKPQTTERVNLGKTQEKTTEVRWQSTSQTKQETGPWQLVDSTTRVDRSHPTPTTVRLQPVRTDLYSQRTTTYPLEAKEQRTKTTTTQNYELRSYTEESTRSTVMVPVSKDVGEWVKKVVDKPVTTPMQVWSDEPVPVPTQEPIYRTVTSTFSIPSQPILTPFATTRMRQESKTETVNKEREVTETTTVTKYVTSARLYDRDNKDADIGKIELTDLTQGVTITNSLLGTVYMTFKRKIDGLSYEYEYSIDGLKGTCTIALGAGNNSSNVWFEADPRWFALSKWWGKKFNARTSEDLIHGEKVTTTKKEPYTETVTKQVDVPYPATFSIQLETIATAPKDLQGGATTEGVFWKHYHAPNVPCPYRPVVETTKWVPRVLFGVTTNVPVTDPTELNAAKEQAVMAGNLAGRIETLAATDQATFSVAFHHTAALPTFEDDATPARIGSREDKIFERMENKTVWVSRPQLVTKQVPVQKVVGWVDKGPQYRYVHAHDASVQCENKYLTTSPSPVLIAHSRDPILQAVTEPISVTEWATHSVTTQEPRTVTSTVSVLVSTIPGQEVTVSYSPWMTTGETRPIGDGISQDATRSVDIAGQPTIQTLIPQNLVTIEPIKPQSSTYTSDQSTGNRRQTITGLALRLNLKANEALASQARRPQGVGSILQDSTDPRPNVSGEQSGRSIRGGLTGNQPESQSTKGSDNGEEPSKKDKVKKGKSNR